ncbi:MAG TPA: ribosome small subunit-dependent GTPase A [Candidatus Obscuribacterales bacterium]
MRRHAGGYLVHSDELDAVLQCPVRARLKKEGTSIFAGDRVDLDEVELTDNKERGSAVIAARLDRQNLLTRPYIANVDQVIIVQAIHQPEFNSLLCDRYLVHLQLELPAVRTFVCVNKCDLATDEEISALRNIYESAGHSMIALSAKTGLGMEELRRQLAGNRSVLTGPSGVGKSSILNVLNPELHLKVDVHEELLVGRHTTSASELYQVPADHGHEIGPGWIADTPGYSLDQLRHPEPAEVAWQFPELAQFAEECKFSDCLHLAEQNCNVLAHVERIPKSRYESYCTIVAEAQQERKFRQETSQKVDAGAVKYVGGEQGRGKAIPKLSNRHRAPSRRKEKQQLHDYDRAEDADLDDDE